MEVVLADGSVTWFGGKRRKDVTGYDFVHLMVGSEGTLGLITKIVLKLLPLPAFGVDLLIPFPTVESAIRFVPRIALEGKVTPASIELVDHHSLSQAEKFLNTKLPFDQAAAHLIVQLEGNDREVVADETERVGKLALEKGALEVFVADNRSSRDKLWKARKSVAEAIMAYYKNYAKEDLVVPTNRVPDLLFAIDALCRKWDMEASNYGHVGDGNIHVNLLMADDRPHWHDDMEQVQRELYETVRQLGGTLSGEHGIGLKRKAYLPQFLDEAQLDLMRRVKLAFDPKGIMNPGKLVYQEPEEGEARA
jgi:glycolate oxidase